MNNLHGRWREKVAVQEAMAIFRSILEALVDSVNTHKPVTEGCIVGFHLLTSNMSQYDNLNVLFREPVWSADHEQVRQVIDHTL